MTDLAYLALTGASCAAIGAFLAHEANRLRHSVLHDALMDARADLAERNKRLIAITALETPAAAAAAKKMAAIARGAIKVLPPLGKATIPIRPRAEIEVEAADALAARRASRPTR